AVDGLWAWPYKPLHRTRGRRRRARRTGSDKILEIGCDAGFVARLEGWAVMDFRRVLVRLFFDN
ncbi:hypothetical protein, partial [Agrobacterium albertimagni]|uniref:hypothetical protein n=1 Tax=Agrobacterium albertimagni TaxID=147266 RepID=UPI001AEBE812